MRLTIAALEAEQPTRDPFEIDLQNGADPVSLAHPEDLPFNSLVNFNPDQPVAVLRTLMGDEAFDSFASSPRVTLGVFKQVLDAYYAHFGLGSSGEAGASQPSSTGSARPSKRTSAARAKAKAS